MSTRIDIRSDLNWRLFALCAQIGNDSHFAEKGELGTVRDAKKVCARCPVETECLADALDYEAVPGNVRHGVRAGTTPADRELMAQDAEAAA